MEESELIGHAQSGDRDAFRRLVEIHSEVAGRTARVLLADRADAEDAEQEAWLDAWRALPRFEKERPFRPWLLAIVANRCRMKARKYQPITTPYNDEIDEEMITPGPIDTYDEELDRAMSNLDTSQRQILALRFYADLQLDEIATLINVPIGTVKSRLHRSIATLRTNFTEKSLARKAEE